MSCAWKRAVGAAGDIRIDREPERVLADVRGGFVTAGVRSAPTTAWFSPPTGVAVDDRSDRRAACEGSADHQTLSSPRVLRDAGMTCSCFKFSIHADGVLIGIDTGGTFTDVALLDPASGEDLGRKTSSTPDDPSIGFMPGIADGLAVGGVEGASVGRVLHGTTVATNLILERKGPSVAILVTDGFKHILEIGRHDIPAQIQSIHMGQAGSTRTAAAYLGDPRATVSRGSAFSNRWTKRRCARPRGRSPPRAFRRSRSFCCTAMPIRNTSVVRPRSCAPNIRKRSSPCRATFCRFSASTSVA
jgi:hypothetical protein